MVANEIPESPPPEPTCGLSIGVFTISVVVSLLAGDFAWSDVSELVAVLNEGRVRLRFDWMSLAIPGVLIATVTLAVLTAMHLVTGRVVAGFRRVGNALFVAGVGLALVGWFVGGAWLESLLEGHGYHPCPAHGPTRLFSAPEVWATHEAFCLAGPEVDGLTIDRMRRDLTGGGQD